ncbi:response regulator [Spirulina subsalsa FACHB-351]|uniref:histidine kinase n=1 Tax=Spirulina subsalsa FACHB-351 TaxID=234711 RepID=A0ABT3L0E8_9CYAN|nr:response regulator [Spirulina subsalsa]MCW6034971.1 response regulator [Spirulina subsalsa FACHB-351]
MTGNTEPSKGKILVVDDLPENLRLLAEVLSQKGYEVRLAPDGKFALASISRFRPDLILLDINMPQMDGYEVCRYLKSQPQTVDIPVIFLSAYQEVLDKQKAFAVGGVDYISKPFQVEEVLLRVENHLKLQRLHQEVISQREELKARNEELQREIVERRNAEELAHSALNAKNQFLAQVNHELRTPLSVILGFARIMRHYSPHSAEEEKWLDTIIRNGEHLLALINDVLDLAKIEAGRVTLEENEVTISVLLNDLRSAFLLPSQEKGLEFEVDCASAVPKVIYTDEVKLRQVLINLLSNAVKFTEQGKVRLQVTPIYEQEDQPPTALKFAVKDSGEGIAPEEINKLFEAFAQTRAGRKSSSKGTGLGLVISQNFVRLLGGKIEVESRYQQGSCFHFNLPLKTPTALASPKPSSGELHCPIVSLCPDSQPCRVLIVDDYPDNRAFLEKRLTSLGFEVEEAQDGYEAIAQWRAWHPHLILMDLLMPNCDGYEATQQIRQQEETAPTVIFALTTDISPASRDLTQQVGCNDILYKPIDEQQLFTRIAQALQLSYVYASPSPDGVRSGIPSYGLLSVADLQVMPTEWVTKVHYAAQALDVEQIRTLMTEIPASAESLSTQLKLLLDNFDLDTLRQLTTPD